MGGTDKTKKIMSIEQTDSNQTLLLTHAISLGSLDTVAINMATSAGWPVVTNHMTNLNINDTNQSVANNSTDYGVSSCSSCHEWVWFWLEGQSGCSLGLAQMECQSITLIIHQELGVMPLQIQWLKHHDVLIEFDSEVDVEWVVQKLLRMEQWKGSHITLSVSPLVMKKGFDSSREGNGLPLGKTQNG